VVLLKETGVTFPAFQIFYLTEAVIFFLLHIF